MVEAPTLSYANMYFVLYSFDLVKARHKLLRPQIGFPVEYLQIAELKILRGPTGNNKYKIKAGQ